MSVNTAAFERTVTSPLETTRPLGRVLPLDGLRGLLALGVFLHHAAIYQNYLRDGAWSVDARFFGLLGPLGVTLFFMVTAYLFYGRLIDEQGRPDWRRLYIGRLFRIGPVYLLAVLALFGIVAAQSSWQLKVPPGQLAGEVVSWLALGAGPRVDLNGFPDTRHLLAGVTWTLQSEWLFYASLPLLALATRAGGRRYGLPLLLPAIGLAITLGWLLWAAPTGFPACVAPFFAGMLCAALQRCKAVSALPDRLASAIVVTILAGLFAGHLLPAAPLATLLLGTAFYLIVSGCTLGGLLTCRPARWLGDISYGVYMLHGLVLSLLALNGDLRAAALAAPAGHWFMIWLATGCLLILADAAHVFIERPGIGWGRRVAGRRRRTDGLISPSIPLVKWEAEIPPEPMPTGISPGRSARHPQGAQRSGARACALTKQAR